MTTLGFVGLFMVIVSATLLVAFIFASAFVLFSEWLEDLVARREASSRLEEDRAVAALNRIWETDQ